MRRSVLLSMLLVPTLASAVPLSFQNQGRIFDDTGAPLDGSHVLEFELFDADSGGNSLWSESLTVDFDQGYYSVRLGASSAIDPADIDGSDLWLELTVDSGTPLAGRLQLDSVPYAIRALDATNVSGGVVDATEIRVNGTTVIDGTGAVSAPVSWNDLTDVPAGLDDGDDDALGALTGSCNADQVLMFDGASWGCGDAWDHIHDAVDIASGTIDINRLPVGTSTLQVAAGDHVHDASDITSGVLDVNRVPELDAAKITSGQFPAARLPDQALPNLGCTTDQLAAHDGSQWVCILPTDLGLTAADVGAVASSGGTISGDVGVTGNVQIGNNGDNTCDSSVAGSVRWSGTDLEVCDGTDWLTVNVSGRDDGSSSAAPAVTCNTLHAAYPTAPSGIYWLDPDGTGATAPFRTYCDMSTDGGGWTMVWKMHHNTNHSNPGPASGTLSECNADPYANSDALVECNIPKKWSWFAPSEIRLANNDFELTTNLSYDWKYTNPSATLDSGNNILPYTSAAHFVKLADNCKDFGNVPPTTDTAGSGYWTDKASPGSSGNWDINLSNALFDANCHRTFTGSGGRHLATTFLFVR